MTIVNIPTNEIHDRSSFHEVFKRVLGFPDFYGRNMDAWIDCMSSIDEPQDGMSKVTVKRGEILILRIDDAFGLRHRCPEQYYDLVQGSALVNWSRTQEGDLPVLALLFNDDVRRW